MDCMWCPHRRPGRENPRSEEWTLIVQLTKHAVPQRSRSRGRWTAVARYHAVDSKRQQNGPIRLGNRCATWYAQGTSPRPGLLLRHWQAHIFGETKGLSLRPQSLRRYWRQQLPSCAPHWHESARGIITLATGATVTDGLSQWAIGPLQLLNTLTTTSATNIVQAGLSRSRGHWASKAATGSQRRHELTRRRANGLKTRELRVSEREAIMNLSQWNWLAEDEATGNERHNHEQWLEPEAMMNLTDLVNNHLLCYWPTIHILILKICPKFQVISSHFF